MTFKQGLYIMVEGSGCKIYESQEEDNYYCRECNDDICLERWKIVETSFKLNKQYELTDSQGLVYLIRVDSVKRPIKVKWDINKDWNYWDKSTFLLYWKSLDENKEYSDPAKRTQAVRISRLVGIKANII